MRDFLYTIVRISIFFITCFYPASSIPVQNDEQREEALLNQYAQRIKAVLIISILMWPIESWTRRLNPWTNRWQAS